MRRRSRPPDDFQMAGGGKFLLVNSGVSFYDCKTMTLTTEPTTGAVPTTAAPPSARSGRRRWGLALAAIAVLGLSIYSINLHSQRADGLAALALEKPSLDVRTPSPRSVSPEETAPAVRSVIRDTGKSKLPLEKVVGKWVLNETIRRSVEMRADGTATMHVKLDFFGSLLYGSELNMELTWSVDDDVLSHTLLRGEPKANVDRLIRDFGNSRQYRIIELNDAVLLLEEFDAAKTRYRWEAGQ